MTGPRWWSWALMQRHLLPSRVQSGAAHYRGRVVGAAGDAADEQMVSLLKARHLEKAMKTPIPSFAILFAFAVPALAQHQLPILDVHLHASAADQQGPPPLAMCTPIPEFPTGTWRALSRPGLRNA